MSKSKPFFLLILIVGFLTAFQILNPKLIVGEWQLTDFTFQSLEKTENKSSWESNIENLKQTSSFIFTDEKEEGKRYEITLNGRKEEGIWDVSDDQLFLLTQSDDGASENLEILQVSENEMILRSVIAQDTVQMTLQKVN